MVSTRTEWVREHCQLLRTSCVVPVPAVIDAAVATSYLDRKYRPA
jgi:hypothetical protein